MGEGQILSAVVGEVSQGGAIPRASEWKKRGGFSGQRLQAMSSPSTGGELVRLCVTSGKGVVCHGMRQRPGDGDVIRTLIPAIRHLLVTGLTEWVAKCFTQ